MLPEVQEDATLQVPATQWLAAWRLLPDRTSQEAGEVLISRHNNGKKPQTAIKELTQPERVLSLQCLW